MANLVVVVFNDEVTAFEMRTALLKMQQEYPSTSPLRARSAEGSGVC
jgi:hypothetical protein